MRKGNLLSVSSCLRFLHHKLHEWLDRPSTQLSKSLENVVNSSMGDKDLFAIDCVQHLAVAIGRRH